MLFSCIKIKGASLCSHLQITKQANNPMELKKELLEWYSCQLQQKNIFISNLDELSTGYPLLEVLHNYHPKTVDLSRIYVRPKNQYQVLQNYKHLVNCFSQIGWKRFDPQRYAKRKEKDYLSLAQTIKKILSNRSIKDSRLQSNLDLTLQEFRSQGQEGKEQREDIAINANMARLQKRKKELLSKIARIQQEIGVETAGDQATKIDNLRQRILTILRTNQPS